ncbi:MAG: hypothetical protein KGL53_02345 [Elusimicrobia bacterium]|nr:hypothetical protein [Elusimicrobiota bacterium]
MELLEVLTVGLPFCAFKALVGLSLQGAAAPWRALGDALLALGAVDLLLNLANLAGLLARRRRVVDACLLGLAAKPLVRRPGPSWRKEDLGNSVDVLLAMSLVAYMIGAGRLGGLAPGPLAVWNVSVILNVLGAGLLRLAGSWRSLSAG